MGKQLATTTDPASLLPPVEEVAQAIVQISEGMKKLTASRLRKRAILILLRDQCGVMKLTDIERVVDSLEQMDKHWLKPLVDKQQR